MDGVAVSLIQKPVHYARLCEWLLNLAHMLLASQISPNISGTAITVSAHLGMTEVVGTAFGDNNAVQTSHLFSGANDAESPTPVPSLDPGAARTAFISPLLRRHFSATEHATALAIHGSMGIEKRFQYFLDKICKIQV